MYEVEGTTLAWLELAWLFNRIKEKSSRRQHDKLGQEGTLVWFYLDEIRISLSPKDFLQGLAHSRTSVSLQSQCFWS